MWIEDGWTSDENTIYGYPFNTDACLIDSFDDSGFNTLWTFNDEHNYGYPYILNAGLINSFDDSEFKTLWQFDAEYYYGYPFIVKAESYVFPSPIRVGSKDVKIIINKSRLATRVYVGDILIEDYLDHK
jgi:hypothetical protein